MIIFFIIAFVGCGDNDTNVTAVLFCVKNFFYYPIERLTPRKYYLHKKITLKNVTFHQNYFKYSNLLIL